MTIGTPVSLGTNSVGATGTTIALTALANIVSGDTVLVWVGRLGAATITGVTDGTNTYTQVGTSVSSGSFQVDLWKKDNASAVSSPTITATLSTTEIDRGIAAIRCPGLSVTSPLDKSTNQSNQSGTGASVSTGALSFLTELVVGSAIIGSGLGTFSTASGFSQLIGVTPWSANWYIDVSYKIVSSSASVSYAPNWTNSVSYTDFLDSFKGGSQQLPATAGSFAISGAALTLVKALHLTLGLASYIITGTTIPGKAWGMIASAGSYVFTGIEMVQSYFPGPANLVRKIKPVLAQIRTSLSPLSK